MPEERTAITCQRICDVLGKWTTNQNEEARENIHRLFSYPIVLGMNLLANTLMNDYSDREIEDVIDKFFKDFLIVGITGESSIENSKGQVMMRRKVIEDE